VHSPAALSLGKSSGYVLDRELDGTTTGLVLMVKTNLDLG